MNATTWTLWMWSGRNDAWLWLTECVEENKKFTLRGFKRRNPRGTRFKWKLTEEGAPKRFRARTKA